MTTSTCEHDLLCTKANAAPNGYKRPSDSDILAALELSTGANSRSKNTIMPDPSTFPLPLVLPGDELDYDPEHSTDTFRDWDKSDRNKVTSRRRTVYVVPPPSVSEEVAWLTKWTRPRTHRSTPPRDQRKHTTPLLVDDVADYLQAFYHGMSVKILKKPHLQFVEWDESAPKRAPKANTVTHIGLAAGEEVVRVRSRRRKKDAFPGQLHLNDLLDVAIDLVPLDAYALLMLVDHDMFEDEEDDFCCGRAYGGSRVAVVSTARYSPQLDEECHIDVEHVWPASHCAHYTNSMRQRSTAVSKKEQQQNHFPDSILAVAVYAFNAAPAARASTQAGSEQWLARVCKTASHELGHCFGLDHCSYFACMMQGTANMAEDLRQPPYLCPVDLIKILHATGSNMKRRYQSLLSFCEQYPRD